MTKVKLISKSKRAPKSQILGVTHDGVEILKPRGKPTHFTNRELVETIRRVKQSRAATGDLSQSPRKA